MPAPSAAIPVTQKILMKNIEKPLEALMEERITPIFVRKGFTRRRKKKYEYAALAGKE